MGFKYIADIWCIHLKNTSIPNWVGECAFHRNQEAVSVCEDVCRQRPTHWGNPCNKITERRSCDFISEKGAPDGLVDACSSPSHSQQLRMTRSPLLLRIEWARVKQSKKLGPKMKKVYLRKVLPLWLRGKSSQTSDRAQTSIRCKICLRVLSRTGKPPTSSSVRKVSTP